MGLYLHETGMKSANTILFLHGGGMDGSIWEPSMSLLKDYHCIAPDLPEHGKSISDSPLRMDRLVVELEKLIDEHGNGRKVHLIGLALGGAVALNLAAKAPDKVAGVIAVGTATRTGMIKIDQGMLRAPYYEWIAFDRINRLMNQFFEKELEYEERLTLEDEVVSEDDVRQMKLLRTGLNLPLPYSIPVLALAAASDTRSAKEKTRDFAHVLKGIGGLMPAVQQGFSENQPEKMVEIIKTWVEKGKTPGWLAPIPE